MGLSVVAAHLLVLITLASAGTIAIAAAVDAVGDNVKAQNKAIHRLKATAGEEVDLTRVSTQGNRLQLTFVNNGSEEINITDVSIFVDGTWRDTDTLRTFEVAEAPGSNVWAPGEHLDVEIDNAKGSDVTLVAPHGAAAYRRA